MKRRNFLKITLPLALAGTATGASTAAPDFSFGVIADPQYADAEAKWGRFYRNSLAKLEYAVADLNKLPLDFTVTLGDLIDRDFASFASIMPIYKKLTASHFPICGNHDFEVADADKGKVLGAMGLEKPYYAVIRKSWRFLFLDGTDIALWRYPADDSRTDAAKLMLQKSREAKLPYAQDYNAAIGSEQMKWISSELDAAKAAGERVILFCHYPVIPAGNSHNLWNAEELVALIKRHKHVVAYLNGHNHAGNYGIHGSCHYVNLKGMVETETETAYSVVKCFPDRLEIEGYGLELERKLEALNG
jgi:3',5'-cyclic AMP phosphodiesterase CpdA